jgi:hypothetical protein
MSLFAPQTATQLTPAPRAASAVVTDEQFAHAVLLSRHFQAEYERTGSDADLLAWNEWGREKARLLAKRSAAKYLRGL